MVHCASGFVRVSLTCLLLVCFAYPTYSLSEGSACQTKEGEAGKCTKLTSCLSQLKKIQRNQRYRPVMCTFKDLEPIVCCGEFVTRNETQLPAKLPVGKRAEEACRSVEQEVGSMYVPYVINGVDTFSGEFPHMAAIGFKKETNDGHDWLCGGSLISRNFVLTAAHCVLTRRGKPEVVWIGVYNLTQSAQGRTYPIAQDIVHPEYSAKANYYDLALLKLLTAVQYETAVYPACLYTKPDDPRRVVVTGWGTYDEELSRTSDVLLKATLVTVPRNECNTTFARRGVATRLSRGISADMICARGADRISDTCSGDSGGPMQVLRDQGSLYDLIGVTSFGASCGSLGVYVRVASFIDWIEPIVWPT